MAAAGGPGEVPDGEDPPGHFPHSAQFILSRFAQGQLLSDLTRRHHIISDVVLERIIRVASNHVRGSLASLIEVANESILARQRPGAAAAPPISAIHLRNVTTALQLWEDVEQAAHSLLARRRQGTAVGPAQVCEAGYVAPRREEHDDL